MCRRFFCTALLALRQSFALQNFDTPLGKRVTPPSQMNNLFGGVILLCFFVSIFPAFAEEMGAYPVFAEENTISVIIEWETAVNFADQAPLIENGRTLVPVRDVFEALGFSAEWNAEVQQVTLVKGQYVVILTINSPVFVANGAVMDLDVPAQIIGGRTMLPLRAILESVGYGLEWNGATSTIFVFSQTQEEPMSELAPREWRIQEITLRKHPEWVAGLYEWLNLGDTVVILDNLGHEIGRFVDGDAIIFDNTPYAAPYNHALFGDFRLAYISQIPEYSAPRATLETNGEVWNTILEFVKQRQTTEFLGIINTEPRPDETLKMLAFSDDFLARLKIAFANDPASQIFGLNQDGASVFFDSLTAVMRTRSMGAENADSRTGNFYNQRRIAEFVMNDMNGSAITALAPERSAEAAFVEIFSRGNGFEPFMANILREHFGLPSPAVGLFWDATLPLAIAEAAGGLHLLFDMAMNHGEAGVRAFFDENILLASSDFDFGYDEWQRALAFDRIFHLDKAQLPSFEGLTYLGSWHRELSYPQAYQEYISIAVDVTASSKARSQAAELVNGVVTEINGLFDALEIEPTHAVNNGWLPLFNANDLTQGILPAGADRHGMRTG
ncbi:MAG: copper amine oxidase N-terminal domain-containing protein [Defluviitaleaceae bacterium]|nr:copper amine oxidase N-terminal domain-containing protein [Defluviitaleaceae bacterium]